MVDNGLTSPPQFPRLPWFPRDFASATRGWPLIARGIYRELLDAQWDMGALPNDEMILRRIVGATEAEWKLAWPILSTKTMSIFEGDRNMPTIPSIAPPSWHV